MKKLLIAATITAASFASYANANGCVGSYVGPLVIDAERGHSGMVETTVRTRGQVTVVLVGNDKVVDWHLESSSSNMRAELSQDGKSLIMALGSFTTGFTASIQTQLGRLHMVNVYTDDKTEGIPYGSKILFEN
ncbi:MULTISPECIES: hypothetical protein [unclassified Vibrio]|uniref:hypothetical protein n=1 Tax=Vibrio TaxID=662 RepID=UPI00354CBA52